MSSQIQIMLQQAIQAFQGGNFERAESILVKILRADSKNLTAFIVFGLIKASQAKYKEASDFLSKAARIKPNDALIEYNLAKALSDLGNDKHAITHHKKAVELDSRNPDAWFNYGLTLFNLKQYNQALHSFDKALNLKSSFVEALFKKGYILYLLNKYDEAIAQFDKALVINPNFLEAWCFKGIVLNQIKWFDEAIAHFDKALSLKPNFVEGWINKGNTLNQIKRLDEAIIHYNTALTLKKEIDWVAGDLLHMKMKICNWSDFEISLEILSEKTITNHRVSNPFVTLTLNDNISLHKKIAEIYTQSKYPSNSFLGPIFRHSNNQKIRVGYFSADFHNHATGHLMAELFELHDKGKFELIGFSFGPITNDAMRKRLEKSFDQFIEVGRKSDDEVAKLSRELNIDIAVDLKGFTQDARTGIFAYRAAPIQVNYLGYPGTMGADYIDYIIADKTLIPPQSQQFYSEKVVYLPDSYQVNDRKRVISDTQFTRQELGLSENGFVFCCFNNNFKISPATFAGWMRILKAAEGSVLWLFQDNSWAAENLKKEANKQGIDPHRLVFAEHLPLLEHLARHRQADLFLDTLPYNAHTTASDALWAGLPVLTLMGRSFAGRVAASLLNAIGLPELVTHTQEEYEALAIELATSPNKLNEIKSKLANNRLTTPLFDTPGFTKNLEAAYVKMYERYQADLEPDHITI